MRIPKTNNQIVIQGTANYDASQYALLSKGFMFVQTTGTNTILHLSTADTAAEATRLLKLFNITDTTTTRLLRVSRVNTVSADTIDLGNGNGITTSRNVQFGTAGTALGGGTSQVNIAIASSVRDSIILISKVAAIAPNTGDAILFDVISVA